jgi:methylmalonyl-CoA/ethylmalonyl-CoA epimerase
MSAEQGQKLSESLLGTITEVCIVTPNLYKTASGLHRLGIGPFQVFDFTSTTVTDRHFRNKPGDFELKVAFAKQGALVFELMQPMTGESLMAEYLARNGGQEGIQHIAFDMADRPMVQRRNAMEQRGFALAMEGRWLGSRGKCHFCFFDTLEATGTILENIDFSEDWEDPACEWYPVSPVTVLGEEKVAAKQS